MYAYVAAYFFVLGAALGVNSASLPWFYLLQAFKHFLRC